MNPRPSTSGASDDERQRAPLELVGLGRRRAVGDSGFRLLTLGCGLVVLVVLGLITVSTTRR